MEGVKKERLSDEGGSGREGVGGSGREWRGG